MAADALASCMARSYTVVPVTQEQGFQLTGPHLNIKKSFPGMGIPMLKIRRSRDRLIFNMGIPILSILVRWHLETAPSTCTTSMLRNDRKWEHIIMFHKTCSSSKPTAITTAALHGPLALWQQRWNTLGKLTALIIDIWIHYKYRQYCV